MEHNSVRITEENIPQFRNQLSFKEISPIVGMTVSWNLTYPALGIAAVAPDSYRDNKRKARPFPA